VSATVHTAPQPASGSPPGRGTPPATSSAAPPRQPVGAGRSPLLIGETISVALSAVRANKLRSFLTMLGVVIGVAAVIAMVAIGRGAQESVNQRISALGTTLVTVLPGQVFGRGVASGTDRAQLTMDDAAALVQHGTYIAAVEPEIQRQTQVQFGSMNANTSVIGTTPNYLEVQRYQIASGRMFTDAEDKSTRRVAVIGQTVLTNLGVSNPDDIIGQNIRIQGIQFLVVGVLASKGQGSTFGNPDDEVLVPITTARYRIAGSNRIRSISVLAPSESTITMTIADIQKILRREHKLRPGQDNDFNVRNQADFLNTLGETTKAFTYLLAGIAAVSLVVGGIGIMNIMLVSVTERTREIGVRKALGATRKTIMLQFLVEAVVLCMLGGIGGVIIGGGGAIVMSHLAQWKTSVSWASVALALGFSAAVGILFGVWPARRAAALDPIEALRYE
jgi:putative ABC transport system permease protein